MNTEPQLSSPSPLVASILSDASKLARKVGGDFVKNVLHEEALVLLDLLIAKPDTIPIRRDIYQQIKRKLLSSKEANRSAFALGDDDIMDAIEELTKLDNGDWVLKKLSPLTKGDLKLEKPTGVHLNDLMSAIDDKKLIYFNKDSRGVLVATTGKPVSADYGHSFLVEHDWASAFGNVKDFYYTNEFPGLPFDVTTFEYRISGFNICARTHVEDDHYACNIFIQIKDDNNKPKWVHTHDSVIAPLLDLIDKQTKAICISLDAEVAELDVIRAPHRLNQARERRGQLPLADYHVVRLSSRSRAAPLEDPSGEPGTRKRLHFRRGHWRHYENHKVWIKWMLVGDPDLGFIDKHYRM